MAADGSIRIDTQIDDNNVTKELRALQREMKAVGNEMKMAHMQAVLPFRREMAQTEMSMLKLANTMGNYSGTNKQFMGEVNALGQEYKKTQDAMINADRTVAQSMIQTAGQMANMSTQASKISAEYDRMNNPLLKVNKGGLAVANSLNKIANNGNAASIALKKLGPNASMKQLYDMQGMINQGLMRFNMVAIAALATSVMVYGGMHKAALEANVGYKKSFEDMVGALKKATQPLIDVFEMVMIPIFNGITAVANWVSAFSEAHPVIAKVVAGILLLLPALTLLLSPLAIGIGLFAGMQAALASIWPIIGPLVTGLAAMSGTVWIVAAAIAGLVTGIIYLWNNHEGFRNAVVSGWETIKSAVQSAISLIQPLIDSFIAKVTEVKTAFVNAFSSGDWSGVLNIFAGLIPSIISLLVGGIPGLLITAARFIPAIAEGMSSGSGSLAATITTIFETIENFITTQLPIFIEKGVAILQNIINGIVTALPLIAQTILTVITSLVTIITTLLPVLLQSGIQILQAIINGILTLLPVLLDVALNLITSVITILSENLPLILNAGISILLALIAGIIQILPQLVDTAITLVNTIVELVIENLPLILDAGIGILLALVDGIVEMLPKLIDCAVTLIIKTVETLIENLPKIIDAGVKLLLALIDGIAKILPQLVICAINLIVKVASTLIENLPKIISAGKDLIIALIEGIVSLASKLGSAILRDIVPKIVNTIKDIDLFEIGKNIIKGLINGIGSMAQALWDKVKSMAEGIASTISSALGIHSPSRVTAELGEWTGIGMEVGLDNTVKRVTAAANRLAQAAVPKLATSTGGNTTSYDYSQSVQYDVKMMGTGNDGSDVKRALRQLAFQYR